MDRRNRPGRRRARARPAHTVILFARTVRLGRGKRRLARDIGDIGAWRFYRNALKQTLNIVSSNPVWTVIVALDPAKDAAAPGQPFIGRRSSKVQIRPQRRGGLGVRMVAALNQVRPGPAVLIGADIQGLTAAALQRGLKAATAADIIFGPATDGGFWLIGARAGLSLRQFQTVAWSTPATLEQAEASFPAGKRRRRVDMLADVDNASDLPESR